MIGNKLLTFYLYSCKGLVTVSIVRFFIPTRKHTVLTSRFVVMCIQIVWESAIISSLDRLQT